MAAAAVVVVLAAFVALRALDRDAVVDTRPQPASPVAATVEPARAAVRAIRAPAERRPPTVERKPAVNNPNAADEPVAGAGEDQPEISAGEYIAALRAAGETQGLAAFPPPGTRPPEPGIIVPDDYELPEGYMRHYQNTDDGRQLEPVLTLAPGYELVDENGNALALGRDRIVPPELAPPDLPVRVLEVPPSVPDAAGAR